MAFLVTVEDREAWGDYMREVKISAACIRFPDRRVELFDRRTPLRDRFAIACALLADA